MIGIRRRAAPLPEEGVQLGLIITPMLDMAFQLMAFFVMVYNPSPLETHLDGRLKPFSKGAGMVKDKDKAPDKDAPPVDVEPEENVDLRIIVKAVAPGKSVKGVWREKSAKTGAWEYRKEAVRRDGEPTEILLKYKDKAEPVPLAGPELEFDLAVKRLGDKLKELRAAAGKAETQIDIDPDSNLRYQHFVEVYDACRAAKFGQIGFNAPLK
jgi:biopolymer transport protein ExbD